MTKKVVIDPGHGGQDTGAVGFGLQEKNINLDIALHLRGLLANLADVSMTRSSDTFISLSERAALANKLGADLFVSIHVNAGGGTGFESFVFTNANAECRKTGEVLHKEVSGFYTQNGFTNRGLKTANFAVLRETQMPSTLIENLFIDTQKDAERLKEPGFREEIARAIAGGIMKVLDLHAPAPQPAPQPVPPPWAVENFNRLMQAGLVTSQHNLDAPVTWGEMSAVIARLLDKLKL